MSIFQLPKKTTLDLLNKQKYNKIYVFNRKKCNPFSGLSSLFTPLNLQQIAHINEQKTKKKQDYLLNPIDRLFQSQNSKDKHSFSLQYKQQETLQTIISKRKTIKQKLAQLFQNTTLKSKHDRQKNSKLQSFRHSKAVTSKSLISNLKKINKSTKAGEQFQTATQSKKNSLPDLNRHSRTPIQISSVTNSLRRKNIKEKQKLTSPLSDINRSDFIRTGIINGSKISQHKKQQKVLIIKTQNIQPYKLHQQQSPKCIQDAIDHQYPLVKKVKIKNNVDNNVQNQRVSRKNILQIRRRRSIQFDAIKITQITGQSLIKIQKLPFSKQKKKIDQS